MSTILASKYGFAIDNLLSADLVTADGDLLTAGASRTRISSGPCVEPATTSGW